MYVGGGGASGPSGFVTGGQQSVSDISESLSHAYHKNPNN